MRSTNSVRTVWSLTKGWFEAVEIRRKFLNGPRYVGGSQADRLQKWVVEARKLDGEHVLFLAGM